MAETKWTPGPWEADVDTSFPDEIGTVSAEAGTVCLLFDHHYERPLPNGDQAEANANAYLIAAAHDLYKELAHLVQLIKPVLERGSLDVPGLATLNGAHRALAKARGEETP